MRAIVRSSAFSAQTAPPAMATLVGVPPRATAATTRPLAGSTPAAVLPTSPPSAVGWPPEPPKINTAATAAATSAAPAPANTTGRIRRLRRAGRWGSAPGATEDHPRGAGRRTQRRSGAGEHDRPDPAAATCRPLGECVWNAELRALVQHRLLEPAQGRSWLDAEVVDHAPPRLGEDPQRVGLAAGAIQRKHLLAGEPLAQRMLGHESLELRRHLAMAAEREVSVDALLDCAHPQLLEPLCLVADGRLIGEIGERRPAPERQRLAQDGSRALGVAGCRRGAALIHERRELLAVEFAAGDAHPIAVALRDKDA